MKRETTKEVIINEKKYRIEKFNPLLGGYILLKVLTGVIAPFLPAFNVPDQFKAIASKTTGMPSITKEEFIALEQDILSVVSFEDVINDKPIFIPVLRTDGEFNIPELKDDVMSVMKLIGEVLMFNSLGFFGKATTDVASTDNPPPTM